MTLTDNQLDHKGLIDALLLVGRAEDSIISGNWYSGMNETIAKLKRIYRSIQLRTEECTNESR